MITSFKKIPFPILQISPITPDIQRPLLPDVVMQIRDSEDAFFRVHNHYMIPGCLSIAKCGPVENIIDGQHRLAAYRLLAAEFPERELVVYIDYYTCDEDYLNTLYKQVNICTPNPIQSLEVDDYMILQVVEKFMTTNFASYISTSTKPNAPNINIVAIKDLMTKKKLLKLGWKNGEELVEIMLDLNRQYANCTHEQFLRWHVSIAHIDAIRRRPNQLYFGAYRAGEWIDRLIDIKSGNKPTEHYSSIYRPKITKILRRAVWAKYGCNAISQPCYCCGEPILFDSFHCGHIVPIARGGKTDISNLESICANCNIDMGCHNMIEYKDLMIAQKN